MKIFIIQFVMVIASVNAIVQIIDFIVQRFSRPILPITRLQYLRIVN